MSHLNIAFDRYASISTVMHYILVISIPYRYFYCQRAFENYSERLFKKKLKQRYILQFKLQTPNFEINRNSEHCLVVPLLN